jgi:hypothetical protein
MNPFKRLWVALNAASEALEGMAGAVQSFTADVQARTVPELPAPERLPELPASNGHAGPKRLTKAKA